MTFVNIAGQSAVIGVNAKRSFVRFDVTDLVKGWMDGSVPNAGVAIGEDASGLGVALALDSKENTATGHPARLDVEFGDLSPLSQNNKGTWSPSASYQSAEFVLFGGSTWIAVSNNSNSQPAQGNADWSVLAQKGDAGIQGLPGSFLQSYKGAWSSLTTYAAGDIVTASNSTWLALTGNTDSQPSGTNGNWVALALQGEQGPPGSIPAGSITTDKFAALPSAVVNRTITESLLSRVDTVLNWNQEVVDTANIHDTTTNRSRLQAPVAGVYLVTLYVDPGTEIIYSIWKNGVGAGTQLARYRKDGNSSSYGGSVTVPAILEAGEYVEAAGNYVNASTTATQNYTDTNARFTMLWISPKQ